MKGKIIMIDGKKIDPDEHVQIQITHKDGTETKVRSDGHIKSMKFQGGLKIRANQ